MNNHFIYRYESPSGKSYIGQTFGDDIERALKIRSCGSNGYGYRGCRKFYNAIKKYGFDKFKVEVLFYGLSQVDANRMEEICISLFRSVEFGYNITPGGGGYNKGKNCHSKDYRREEQNAYRRKRYNAMTPEERKLYNQTHTSNPKRKQEATKRWMVEHPEKMAEYKTKQKDKNAMARQAYLESDEYKQRIALRQQRKAEAYQAQLEKQRAKREAYRNTEEGRRRQEEKQRKHEAAVEYAKKMKHLDNQLRRCKIESTRIKIKERMESIRASYRT